jgi:hypothetical protein
MSAETTVVTPKAIGGDPEVDHSGDAPESTEPMKFPWDMIGFWFGEKIGVYREGSLVARALDALFVDCPRCLTLRALILGYVFGALTVGVIVGVASFF